VSHSLDNPVGTAASPDRGGCGVAIQVDHWRQSFRSKWTSIAGQRDYLNYE
jgi:hypothetical protein